MKAMLTLGYAAATCCLLTLMLLQTCYCFSIQQAEPSKNRQVLDIPLTVETSQGVGEPRRSITNYYAKIELGEPAKSFKVQFDINLIEILIPKARWTLLWDDFHYSKGYTGAQNSSSRQLNKLVYQDLVLEGETHFDKLTLLNDEQKSLWVEFVAVKSVSNSHLGKLPVEGYVGLAPAVSSPQTGANSFLKSLYDAKLIDDMRFSLSLANLRLTLGGYDKLNYNDQNVKWHPIRDNDLSWSLNLTRVSIGGLQILPKNRAPKRRAAILASGIDSIYAPKDEVHEIYANLLATRTSSGLATVSCGRQLRPIDITIDDQLYSIPASMYLKPVAGTGNSQCFINILPSKSGQAGDEWILGTDFLAMFHAMFDASKRLVGLDKLH